MTDAMSISDKPVSFEEIPIKSFDAAPRVFLWFWLIKASVMKTPSTSKGLWSTLRGVEEIDTIVLRKSLFSWKFRGWAIAKNQEYPKVSNRHNK